MRVFYIYIIGLMFLVGCTPHDYRADYAHLDCDQLSEKYNEILNQRERHFGQRMQHNNDTAAAGVVIGAFTGQNSLYYVDSYEERGDEQMLSAIRKLMWEKKCNECKSCGGDDK